jgi:hypothetical protein
VAARMLRDQEDQVADAWRARLTRVRVQLPPAAHVFQHTLYSALWQVLLDRDGAALQPGPRSYARSWIRDGAMMSEALLRMGEDRAVRDYLLWYAPHQFSNGKVPCCVDWKGADPTPENDSQGELIFAIAEYTRYTHDLATARRLWPHVESAVRYMNTLRATQKTAAYRQGERTVLRPDAALDQPRGLFGQTHAFVLGRFLVAARLPRCGLAGRTTRPCAATAGHRARCR